MGLWRKRKRNRLALHEMLSRERKLAIVLLGIICIPMIYSAIYLTAFFDPYEELEALPVAVVNEDQGAESDGEKIDVGKEMVDQLKENDAFDWKFVDRSDMKEGLEKDRYHLAVVIPEDFSERAVSLKDPQPMKGQLEYHVNQGANYLSAMIGDRMIQELKDQVGEKLTQTYTEIFFDQVEQSADNLDRAQEGSSKLAGATEEAEGATGQLVDGASQLSTGVPRLAAAIDTVQQGVTKLWTGLQSGEDGADQLVSGANRLEEGLDQLQAGSEKGIKDIPQLKEGAKQIRDGIGQFKDVIHNPRLEKGASAISEIAGKLQGNSDETERLYDRILKKHPELADDPEMAQLRERLEENEEKHESLLSRAEHLEEDLKQAQSSVDRMYNGQTEVVNGIGAVENGMKEQLKAVKQLHSGATLLSTKLTELSEGLHQLEGGAEKLNDGTLQLAQAPEKLSAGAAKLSDGMKQLAAGIEEISDGQNTLSDKLAEGVDQAREALQGKENKEEQMASPLQVEKHNLHEVPNYGTGFAPYFISLSLWVGAMVLFTILDAKRPELGNDQRPFSSLSTFLISTLQSLLLIWVLIHLVGIQPVHEGWLYLFTLLIGLVFTAINHFLVAAFKDVGRFFAILILMFQLTATSGTYAVDLSPGFFQAIHSYLPMTYAIQGLRAAISTGDAAQILENGKVLFGFGAGAWLLRLLVHQLQKVLHGKFSLR